MMPWWKPWHAEVEGESRPGSRLIELAAWSLCAVLLLVIIRVCRG